MKAKVYTIFTMLLLFAMTSCEHKDLCFDHAHTVDVKVVFDWRNAPGASPASMAVYICILPMDRNLYATISPTVRVAW